MASIIHLGKYYPPNHGGVENATIVAAESASSAGHDVEVLCFTHGEYDPGNTKGPVKVSRKHSWIKLASQPLSPEYLLQSILKARRADIVHLHAPNVLAAFATLFIGKRPKLLVHWHADILDKGWLGKTVSIFQQAMLKRADIIVCTSPLYGKSSESVKKHLKKTITIPLGIDGPEGAFLCTNTREQLKKRLEGRRMLLSVGRLVPYKGFNYLIEAAQKLPDDTFVIIVGTGPERNSLEKQIQSLGLKDRVVLFGTATTEELDTLMRLADLFCLPSINRAEAFGVAIIEAMSYGLPVVATKIEGSGVPWVNSHGESGHNVAPADATALANACLSLLQDPVGLKQFSDNAKNRHKTAFSQEAYTSKLMETYAQLASDDARNQK
jgi:glycosyltransferase involved in cell wall biosynthesis